MINDYHQSVLLHESVEGLNIKPGGIYVDLTLGGGGHSEYILKKLKKGKLIAFDQDVNALKNAKKDKRLLLVHGNFKYLKNYLRYHQIGKVDGILADLGVSSHHFDNPERGFSYRFEGELDMRMNQLANLTAKTIVNKYTESQLTELFKKYGEIKNAERLAYLIVSQRDNCPVNRIEELIQTIDSCLPKKDENKYLSKVFQALRIEVNQEINVLKRMLLQVPAVLKEKGRVVIITYHSLEDRLVKNFIKSGNFKGELKKDVYGNITAPLKAVNRNVIVAKPDEIEKNPRARSAKLRIAEKI